MKVTTAVKNIVKPFVDVPTWLGYKRLSESTKGLAQILKNLFIPAQAARQETFEEAMARLQLTEDDLKDRRKSFIFLAVFWFVVACCVITYAIYLISVGSWHGFVASIAISLVAFVQVFRYHFWLFQIKQRRLGCTFREWLSASFIGTKQ